MRVRFEFFLPNRQNGLTKLEAENAKLKRMYAELALENAAIRDVLSRKL